MVRRVLESMCAPHGHDCRYSAPGSSKRQPGSARQLDQIRMFVPAISRAGGSGERERAGCAHSRCRRSGRASGGDLRRPSHFSPGSPQGTSIRDTCSRGNRHNRQKRRCTPAGTSRQSRAVRSASENSRGDLIDVQLSNQDLR